MKLSKNFLSVALVLLLAVGAVSAQSTKDRVEDVQYTITSATQELEREVAPSERTEPIQDFITELKGIEDMNFNLSSSQLRSMDRSDVVKLEELAEEVAETVEYVKKVHHDYVQDVADPNAIDSGSQRGDEREDPTGSRTKGSADGGSNLGAGGAENGESRDEPAAEAREEIESATEKVKGIADQMHSLIGEGRG